MSEPAAPSSHPFERLREGMKKILTVSKPEILRREEEYRKQRAEQKKRKTQ